MKKLPYGNNNFADIIESGYAYVDKTRYVEMIENEHNRYQYFLRPRRFGKSLFLSVMDNYYDINSKDKFDSLFGDLYIGKHPTPERGTYAIMKFDFSKVDIKTGESFRASFIKEVERGVKKFRERYARTFSNTTGGEMYVSETYPGIGTMSDVFDVAERAGIPVFVMVDEYDNFTSTLIATSDIYKNEIMKDGIVRVFYKALKAGTSTIVKRIFITGVSPMMVNDMTSGFNMASNLSLLPKYNEMFGFTRDEVEWLIDETGIDRSLIAVDMEYYYNGYMFTNKGKDKVYNSQMVLYLLYQIRNFKEPPEVIIDQNLKTGYERLRVLAENENNRTRLLKIMKDGGISVSTIIDVFSLDDIVSEDYFVSLLFYIGMLTCGGVYRGTWLKIPNYSIKTLYWEYMGRIMQKEVNSPLSTGELKDTVDTMAYDGDIVPYLDYFTENILIRLSNRDLQKFDEKYVKVAMLSNLFLSNYYLPKSEDENTGGYSDVYLQKSPAIEGINYEYVLEIKYVKVNADKSKEYVEKDIEDKFAEAFTELEKYKKDKRYADKENIKYAAIVFHGKGEYEMRNAL